MPVAYDRLGATRTSIGHAIDAGIQHILLGLRAPYPENVAGWIISELMTGGPT